MKYYTNHPLLIISINDHEPFFLVQVDQFLEVKLLNLTTLDRALDRFLVLYPNMLMPVMLYLVPIEQHPTTLFTM